ncbi:hypothetical protein BVG19_g1412 [[Candida] boidinii]|nr:hypothetical protein BVG19_g1412 [[Candida] boidinii]OWB50873.1 hypothetical protein B5S27_g2426 [[Candida] boidinii]
MDASSSPSSTSYIFNNKPTSVVTLNSNELHSIDFLLKLKKSQFKIPIELIKKNLKNLNKLVEKHNHTVLKYVSSIEKLSNSNENLDKKLLLLNKLISLQESYNKKLSFRVKQHNDFVDRLIIRIKYLKTLNHTRTSLIKGHSKLLQDENNNNDNNDNNNNTNDDDVSNSSININKASKDSTSIIHNDNKTNNGMSFNEMASYYDGEVNLLLVDYLIKMSNDNYTPSTMESNTGVKLAKFLKLDKLLDYDIILQGLNIYHEIKDRKNLKILIDWCNENKDALKLIRDSNLSGGGTRKQSSTLSFSSDNRSKLRRKSSSISTPATDRPIDDPQNPLFNISSSKSRRNTTVGINVNTKLNNPPVIGYNSLEFEAHFQNFIEYIKDDNLFEALDILNNHLIDYIDTSSSSNLNSTANDSFSFSDIKSRSNSSKRRKSSVISASDFLDFSNERTLDSLNEVAIEDDEDDKDSKSRRASHGVSSSTPRMIIESKYEEDDEEEYDDEDEDDENSENDPLNKNPEAFANFSKIQSGAALLFWNSLSSVVSDAKNSINDSSTTDSKFSKSSLDNHDKDSEMDSDIRSARRTSATLSYYDPEVETSFRINNNLKPYKILLDDERWKQLADFFLFNFNELYGIDQKLSLLTILSCGISALKTKSCENHDFNKNLNSQKDDVNKKSHNNHNRHLNSHQNHRHHKSNGAATINFDNIINDISNLNDKETMIATFSLNSCPVCSTELFELTKELPFSHQIKSNIYENPVMLPNGNIYQRDKLIKINQNFEMAENNNGDIINSSAITTTATNNNNTGSSDGNTNSTVSSDSMFNKSSLPSSTAVTSIEVGEDERNESNGFRNVSVNGLGVFYYDDDETDEEDEADECGAFDNSTLDKFFDEYNLRGSGNGKNSYGNKKRYNSLNDFKIKDPITGDVFNKSQFIKVFPT